MNTLKLRKLIEALKTVSEAKKNIEKCKRTFFKFDEKWFNEGFTLSFGEKCCDLSGKDIDMSETLRIHAILDVAPNKIGATGLFFCIILQYLQAILDVLPEELMLALDEDVDNDKTKGDNN